MRLAVVVAFPVADSPYPTPGASGQPWRLRAPKGEAQITVGEMLDLLQSGPRVARRREKKADDSDDEDGGSASSSSSAMSSSGGEDESEADAGPWTPRFPDVDVAAELFDRFADANAVGAVVSRDDFLRLMVNYKFFPDEADGGISDDDISALLACVGRPATDSRISLPVFRSILSCDVPRTLTASRASRSAGKAAAKRAAAKKQKEIEARLAHAAELEERKQGIV